MAYAYIDTLNTKSKERYSLKLKCSGLTECPYRIPAGTWVNNPQKWPSVQWPDVYSYLIESPGVFTRAAMKNFRSLEAHNYFVSGWVKTVYHILIEGTQNILLAADVCPSQRLNDPPHHPWITCQKDGSILAGHCDCMAGLGESCSHVAALMFKVEAAVRQGYTDLACTEQLCQWNQCFVKKIQPAEIAAINFYKESVREGFVGNQPAEKTHASAAEQHQFLTSLSLCERPPIALSSFAEFYGPFAQKDVVSKQITLPIDMRTLFVPTPQSDLTDAIIQAMEKIKATEKQVNYLESQTRNQSASRVWHQMRIGRITASKAHQFCHTSEERPAQSLIKSTCYPRGPISVPAIRWGKDNEGNALKEFTDCFTSIHENVKVVATGFKISLREPFLGASPDGLVTCSCCEASVVEIKCPFKFRNFKSTDIYADPQCCLTTENLLKKNHEYYSQVQMQMYIFNVVSAQFVFWTPKVCIISKVERNEGFITVQLTKMSTIWKGHILPELLTRSLETQTETAPDNTTDKTYCYCQKVRDDQMIGCDNPDCKFEWFHLSCLKRKTVPKGTWFCRQCKKKHPAKLTQLEQ